MSEEKEGDTFMPATYLREDRDAAVHALCAEYPKTFFVDARRRVPVKHDIEKDIEAELAKNKHSKLLDYDIYDTVEWYCSHVGYKKACSVAGNGRVDLRGVVVCPVTEAEARIADREANEIFADIEARKRQTTSLPRFVAQPPTLAPRPQSLPVDTNLNTSEMLQEIEKQIALARTILGDSPDDPLRQQLVRPALRLMIDELNTIVARIDTGVV
jgi:sRNA-binding protein